MAKSVKTQSKPKTPNISFDADLKRQVKRVEVARKAAPGGSRRGK